MANATSATRKRSLRARGPLRGGLGEEPRLNFQDLARRYQAGTDDTHGWIWSRVFVAVLAGLATSVAAAACGRTRR